MKVCLLFHDTKDDFHVMDDVFFVSSKYIFVDMKMVRHSVDDFHENDRNKWVISYSEMAKNRS